MALTGTIQGILDIIIILANKYQYKKWGYIFVDCTMSHYAVMECMISLNNEHELYEKMIKESDYIKICVRIQVLPRCDHDVSDLLNNWLWQFHLSSSYTRQV